MSYSLEYYIANLFTKIVSTTTVHERVDRKFFQEFTIEITSSA